MAAVTEIVREEIRGSLRASAGAVLMQHVFKQVRTKLDDEKTGAAPLLGLRRRCLVAHGASSINALTHAIAKAPRTDEHQLVDAIQDTITHYGRQGLWPLKGPLKASTAASDPEGDEGSNGNDPSPTNEH